jgi:serine/threonine-protein kinase
VSLAPGSRLGAYDVVSLLGEGGMGQVYRARDTKLNRDVALKILPEAFAQDSDRIARFRREAQVLAALNHPHIAQIHGLEEATGTQFLVLELVDGESLDKRIARGPIPVDEALGIAKQIAEALEGAHEKGIIHRDLKPANIVLTRDGQIKVLDFGLAKATDHATGASLDVMNSPTITSPAMVSGVGVILGTAAYMSPEQAKGRPADKRSDVWAFGCIVLEMLTGHRAFAGEDVTDTLASVLRVEPDWRALPTDAPHLTSVLQRCLDKDPRQRLRDIADFRLLLEIAPAPQGVSRGAPSSRVAWMWAAAALLLIAGGTIAALLLSRGRTIPPPVTKYEVTTSQQEPVTLDSAGANIAISPDGSRIVYTSASAHLVVRQLDQLGVKPIAETDGATYPFFSLNGQHIGFATLSELRRVAVGGGPSRRVCQIAGVVFRGGTWGPNDSIVFALGGDGLYRVPAGGGEPEKFAAPDRAKKEANYVTPLFLPGGRVLVYTVILQGGETRIMACTLDGRVTTTVVEGGFGAQYLPPAGGSSGFAGLASAFFPSLLPPGHLVYGQGDRVMAVPFDVSTLKATGSPLVLQEGVATKVENGVSNVTTASDGTGVYVSGRATTGFRHLIWADSAGTHVARITAQPLELPRYPRLSPDGGRLALTVGPSNAGQIWVYDLAGSVQPLRLTYHDHNIFPIWSPDGTHIVFLSRASSDQLLSIPADGSATEPERVIAHQDLAVPLDWSPDGAFILFGELRHLHLLHVTDGKTRRWLQTPFSETDGRFSPKGQWLAYTSNQSGSYEVWVRPFPGPGAPVPVSSGGGHDPVWSRDGTEVFYRNGPKILSARVVPGTTFRVDAPRVLFENEPYAGSIAVRSYEIAPDGRFVMIENEPTDHTTQASIVVIRNWQETLRAPEKR